MGRKCVYQPGNCATDSISLKEAQKLGLLMKSRKKHLTFFFIKRKWVWKAYLLLPRKGGRRIGEWFTIFQDQEGQLFLQRVNFWVLNAGLWERVCFDVLL